MTVNPTRRGLLQGAGALAGIGLLGSALPAEAARPTSRLVVVFLRGGLDGLSLLAPLGDRHYAAARPTIALPASRAIDVDRLWGWHPEAARLAQLFRRRQLAPVVAVAASSRVRSHFEAMERLETCSSAKAPLRTGWLDRYAEAAGVTGAFGSVAVTGVVPRSLAGGQPELMVPTVDGFQVRTRGNSAAFLSALRTLNADPGAGARMRTAMDAAAALGKLKGRPLGAYPASPLGRALHDVATMVRAGLAVQVATVDAGGWDMHSALGKHAGGWMGQQVRDLSLSLGAFADDLGREWARTTVLVVSEFGRQVAENHDGGVDHGVGATWLVAGGRVRGGRVHGGWPTLRPSALDDGAVAGRVDPRQVLAEVLRDGCGASARAVRTAVPGAPAARLGLFR
jgi:uncharacterized protein (DUF1501 family)